MREVEISAVIPVQDHHTYILECLRSIYGQAAIPSEVVVVDRGSRDETLPVIGDNFPSTRVLRTRRSTGVSRALNRGLRVCQQKYVAVVFPEVKLEKTYFDVLLNAMESVGDDRVGFASGKIFKMFRGPGILDSAGMIFDGSIKFPRKRGEGNKDNGDFDSQETVFGAPRGAVLYRREMLEQIRIGGEVFDETLRGVLEDVDVAWRGRALGWQGLYVPGAKAVYDARTSGPGPLFRDMLAWEYGRNAVILKNLSTADLFQGLPSRIATHARSVLTSPRAMLALLFTAALVGVRAMDIRQRRQAVQRSLQPAE